MPVKEVVAAIVCFLTEGSEIVLELGEFMEKCLKKSLKKCSKKCSGNCSRKFKKKKNMIGLV